MPPSPSPGRFPVELRVESSHKNDDLVLFSEMQNRESDNFLLHASDDFDESISKLRYFSDCKLGVTIPARGESSDLLNADDDKNDYDWLLTPPDTPLFPSLDDDEPRSINTSRGRTGSQPISILLTSTHDMMPRTHRSSASPHRLSPSPRSSYSADHSRTRTSAAPRSRSPPVLRATTSSRRPSPSPPPAKPSPPAQRSLTPTLRRMSTGSSGQAFASKRGFSPVKANGGSSASPKFRGWQSDIPGFSTDAPPNLRTSLTDRSASCIRGFSPSSGSGRGTMPKFGRQSISPSSSRSSLSSQNSADRFSSIISKASGASSCDDDSESHVSVGVSPNAVTRKYKDFANSRAMGFSKRPSRSLYASSTPKRSFDFTLRQMDHRKAPPNMFRPLLSSVPATTFVTGKSNSVHQPVFSRNSSLKSSSNAGPEPGTSLAPDLEGGNHEQIDLAGEWEKPKVHELQEEVFVLDEIREDTSHDICTVKCQSGIENFVGSMNSKVQSTLEHLTYEDGDAVTAAVDHQDSFCVFAVSKIDNVEKISICSKCGKYSIMVMGVHVCQECSGPCELVSSEEPESIRAATQEIVSAENRTCLKCGKNFMVVDMDVCQECSAKCAQLTLEERRTIQVVTQDDGKDKLGHELQSQMQKAALHEKRSEVVYSQHEPSSKRGSTNYSIDIGVCLPPTDKLEENLLKQDLFRPSELNIPESSGDCESPRSQATLNLNKVIQGKGISATNILLDEPSYGGDNANARKCSFGKDSTMTSLSIDLGSSGQMDDGILHHLSRECEMENVKGERQDEINAMKHSLGRHGSTSSYIDLGLSRGTDCSILHHLSSRSEMENLRGEYHSCPSSDSENITAIGTQIYSHIRSKEISSCITIARENDGAEDIILDAQRPDNAFEHADLSSLDHTVTQKVVIGADVCGFAGTSLASSGSSVQLSQENCLQMQVLSLANNPNSLVEACDSCENNGEVVLHENERGVHEIEPQTTIKYASILENDYTPSIRGYQDDLSDVETHSSSLVILDQQIDRVSCQDPLIDCTHAHMPNCVEDFQEDCVSLSTDNDVLFSESALKIAEDPSSEKPTETTESPKKHMQRSYTMEEAADTILFCRSIVQDLAYKAAKIAAEKELGLCVSAHSRLSFMGSTVSNRKDLRKTPYKHTRTPQEIKRKKQEAADKMPSVDPENDLSSNLELASCDTEVSGTVNSFKAPKSEAKCSCTVL